MKNRFVLHLGVMAGLLISLPNFTSAVSTHQGVDQVAAGAGHTCALLADGFVTCWGSGLVATSYSSQVVPKIRQAVAIASGNDFACALLPDTTVECWGSNDNGQLGIGDNTGPLPVMRDTKHTLSSITAITAGDSHACALQQIPGGPSQVYCWGSNSAGQIGNFTVGTHIDFATSVVVQDGVINPALDHVISVTAGATHTCAMRSDATSLCWGYNAFGQLGNGSTANASSPALVTVPGNGNAMVALQMIGSTVSAGGDHGCGLVPRAAPANDSVACWGGNFVGQLGNPANAYTGAPVTNAVPVLYAPAVELNNVARVVAGGDFTCAELESLASVVCWGDNSSGQLANSSAPRSDVPLTAAFHGGQRIDSLSAGTSHACVVINSAVLCWGANNLGQLGLGFTDLDAHSEPIDVAVDAPIFTDNLEDG